MEPKIEKNIPLPKKEGRPIKYPLDKMKPPKDGVYESILCPEGTKSNTVRVLIYRYHKKKGNRKRFVVGLCPNNPTQYRIWRVEDLGIKHEILDLKNKQKNTLQDSKPVT